VPPPIIAVIPTVIPTVVAGITAIPGHLPRTGVPFVELLGVGLSGLAVVGGVLLRRRRPPR
jgi:LPXTG-motif cell wall-anchored protein